MTTKVVKEMLAEGVQDTLDFVSSLPPVENASPFTVAEYILGAPSVLMQRLTTDTTDDQMFQRAADIGGVWNVPKGDYYISSVLVDKDVLFQCNTNTKFIRRADSDPGGATLTATGAACFDIKNHGVSLTFTGGGHYDGNEETMVTANSPKGLFIRIYADTYDPERGDTNVTVYGMTFRNGSVGYIYSAGDKIERRYRTVVRVIDCHMYSTRYGTGQGAVVGSLGYQPTYITAMDYTEVITNNLSMIWDKPILNTTQYAACGILGSFTGDNSGDAYLTAGGAVIVCNGLTTAIGMGRSARTYDDTAWSNNAIGVIDGYGNIDSITVDNMYAVGSRYTTIRAKGSINNFTVHSATLINCFRGVHVGPSSTGPCNAVVRIRNVSCYGAAAVPCIETVGSSATDRLKSVVIEDCHVSGDLANPLEYASSSYGAIRLGSTAYAEVRNVEVLNSPVSGIVCASVGNLTVDSPKVDDTNYYGVHISNVTQLNTVINPTISNTQNMGLSFQPSSSGAKLTVIGGSIDTVGNYGVFVNGTSIDAFVTRMTVSNVGNGTSRGFYCSSGSILKTYDNRVGDGVANPIWTVAGAIHIEAGNSWNPRIRYGTAAPTTGVHARGDKVINTAPSDGGSEGWICTSAGEPGTWKTFGVIEA